MRKTLRAVLGPGIVAVVACASSASPTAPDASSDCPLASAPELPPTPVHTARWAFEPWLSKDYSTTDDTLDFVRGSIVRGIPVGVALLDSPWESNYHSFTPDESPNRYHDFDSLVAQLATLGVRTVVWITEFENSASFDLEKGAQTQYPSFNPLLDEGTRCNFFVDDATSYFWYKGRGAAVDFFNPRARAWWHALQDSLLARGVSGYKVDFGDAYVTSDPVLTAAGPVSHQAYSEAYYHDLHAYAASRVPDFVTMVRGWDESYNFPGRTYARPEDAPVVWAGDNRRDWIGIADVLDTTFRSAQLGYVVLGSDIGGYLDVNDKDVLGPHIPFDSLVFARWTALGALSPFMQLISREDYMPWTIPDHTDETVALYRYWATLHHALVPFWYSLAQESYAKRVPGIVRPIGTKETWPSDYRYALGDAFLVAPILDGSGVRDVQLPQDAAYYDWWMPDRAPYAAGSNLAQYDVTDRSRYPLFVRQGAIVPMHVDSDVLRLGTSASKDYLTLLVYPTATQSEFTLVEDDDTRTTISAQSTAGSLVVSLTRVVKPLLLRVRTDAVGTSATVNGAMAAPVGDFAALTAAQGAAFWYDATTRSTWVRVPTLGVTTTTIINTP